MAMSSTAVSSRTKSSRTKSSTTEAHHFGSGLRDAALARLRELIGSVVYELAVGAPWELFMREACGTAPGRRAIVAWREARAIVGYTAGKRAALADLRRRHRATRMLVFTGDNDLEPRQQHGPAERRCALEMGDGLPALDLPGTITP
jgi:hypothetical protein